MKISELEEGMFLQIMRGNVADYYEVIEAQPIPGKTQNWDKRRHFLLRNHENHTVHLIGMAEDEVQYKVIQKLPEGVEGPNLPPTGQRKGRVEEDGKTRLYLESE